MIKVSDYIAKFLAEKNITTVFELSGGMITHLLDSLYFQESISVVTMHHEQGASFAAEGYARISNLPGVALATSGPGATNLLTGIGSCYFDSTPAIFITGQVNRHELKGDRGIRQLGFQETDIVSMAEPITKWAVQVLDAEQIPSIFEKAFQLSMEGRPGPVLIDIPMDIQRAMINMPQDNSNNLETVSQFYSDEISKLITDIKCSKKPLLLVGRGIRAGKCASDLLEFITKTKIPVISTLLGLDVIPYDNNFRVGFIGSYGNRWANLAFGESDLVIVLGARLDIRQTGADVGFIEKRKIYHVDCVLEEINNRVKGCVPINTDLNSFFESFREISQSEKFDEKLDWQFRIKELKSTWPDVNELSPQGINPNKFIHSLSKKSQSSFAYTADVGSHQMWAAQSLELSSHQQFLTSGGMGAMGFSLPAAIGASIALDNAPVVVLVGDGSFQLNIQELQTIKRNNLPIKIIVFNNNSLGMIRQFQDSYFDSRYQSTYWGYSAPDFEKIAVAYGIEARSIKTENEVDNQIDWLWSDENKNKPQLLQVEIDPKTNTYPKIAFGRPITEMEPFATPIEMEGT
jgi:acetolactate synthase-1/2/3 large subunit